MIFDTLPNQYEVVAKKNSFNPWQAGLLANMFNFMSKKQDLVISPKSVEVITVNMGQEAGHTYFAKSVASAEFPARTKVYVTRPENLKEYASLIFDPDVCYEPITSLQTKEASPRPIDFIVIDMNGESPGSFKKELDDIRQTAVPPCWVLLLQPTFFAF